MDAKLKILSYGNLASFGLFLFGNSINNTPLTVFSLVTGLPNSCYLLAKVPTKEQKQLKQQQLLLDLQQQLGKLQDEKNWTDELNNSQLQRALAEKLELEQELTAQINQLKANHESELARIEDDFKQLIGKHDRELVKTKTEYSAMISELQSEKEQAIAQLQQTYSKAVEQLTQQLEDCVNQAEAIKAESDARLAEANAKLTAANQKETELVKLGENIQSARKNLELEEKRIRLDIRDERGSIQKQLNDSILELKALTAINQRQQQQIVELKQQNEQLFQELYGEKTADALVAQIQALLAEENLPTELLNRTEKNGIDTIYLKALSSNWSQSVLNKVAEVLPGLMPVNKPEIEAKNGRIEVRFDNRSWLDKIKDVSEDWLEKLYFLCAKDGKNLALLGARGKGKTQLAINYIGLIAKHEVNFDVVYIQPKPDEFADFEVAGKVYTPDYVGFESVTGSVSGIRIPSSYEGILRLRDEYNQRNLAKQQAYADRKQMPEFPKVFYFIDELQTLISKEKEYIYPDTIKAENLRNGQTFCGKVIRDAISLGRSLGIIVLVLGQLANPSVYGWLRQDLVQFVTIIMSANIAEFAANYAPTKEEKNRIDKELEVWRKRASIDPSKDYYCYVRPMDQSGYLALMPMPGKYLGSEEK
ncbi:hypothetical protein [Floridanema evergladense]|uniref:ATP-binding protein n=1 Tax=Floridaenema evergladense BLCC-F167 TaxID=3153639 RepID=A0ABV4WV87_9CYAN